MVIHVGWLMIAYFQFVISNIYISFECNDNRMRFKWKSNVLIIDFWFQSNNNNKRKKKNKPLNNITKHTNSFDTKQLAFKMPKQ